MMNRDEDKRELLAAHEAVIHAHLHEDVSTWLDGEADEFVTVNRGEVGYTGKEERAAMRGPYLAQTQFSEYRDLIPPIVKISDDGTLGWLIAQIKVVGQRTMSDGQQAEFDVVYAWIELYEKQDGRWLCIGNVSNAKS
jgi:hypothetical protein